MKSKIIDPDILNNTQRNILQMYMSMINMYDELKDQKEDFNKINIYQIEKLYNDCISLMNNNTSDKDFLRYINFDKLFKNVESMRETNVNICHICKCSDWYNEGNFYWVKPGLCNKCNERKRKK